MRVLIVGCGDLGQLLGARLVAEGHEVVGARRTPSRIDAGSGIEPRALDLREPDGLEGLVAGMDACVFSASPDSFTTEAYAAVYEQGLERLLDVWCARVPGSCSPEGVEFVLVSSTSVYGDQGGEWVDESTPLAPLSPMARSIAEGEALLRAQLAAGRRVALRFGGIYGAGRTRTIDALRAGTATLPPAGEYLNLVHREDAAGMLRHLLFLPDAPEVVVGVDGQPVERREWIHALADRLGIPAPTKEGEPSRRGNKRCRNDVLIATGYRMAFPSHREGIRDLIPD